MWRIFSLNRFRTPDRRRMRAERKHIRERKKSRLRRERYEARRLFRKRFNEFMAHPFAKRKLTATERERLHFKKHLAHERKIERLKWWSNFRSNPWKTLFPSRKHRSSGSGYYLTYSLSKKERKAIAQQKRKQFRENLRLVFTSPDLRRKFGFAYLHSTAYFILAFIVIYIIYQAITIIVSSIFL